jgi:hypothetical protein
VSGTVFAGSGSAAMSGAPGIKDTLDAGSSGADAVTHKVDYAFQNLVVPAEEGNNLIAVDIYRGNVAEATAAATIPYRERDECPPRTPNCHVP